MTEVVVRALIGGAVGALIALFGNIVVLPLVLKLREQDKAAPKVLLGLSVEQGIKFVYRFVMPVLFTGVFAFVAVKLGEPA